MPRACQEEQKMISDTVVCALSDDELDAISGGELVCEMKYVTSFLGYMDIHVTTCRSTVSTFLTATFN